MYAAARHGVWAEYSMHGMGHVAIGWRTPRFLAYADAGGCSDVQSATPAV